MKKNKKTGFTLVELLAVIVILAIILVIAVPKAMSIIEDAKKATIESTAKMIASAAEKAKVQNTILVNNQAITCKDITNINDVDYEDCDITFDENTAKVTIKGSGKFEGLFVCNGTKTNAVVQEDSCGLRRLTVNLDGGTDTVDYEPKYEAGSTVTLTVPTKEGYTFIEWIVSGTGASVNGNTLTMGSENTTVTAVWEEEKTPIIVGEFSTDSWEIIIAAVQQAYENGEDYPYQVGNTKTVDMGSLGVHTIRIANRTKCSEVEVVSKTACGFVLEFADIITIYSMNPAGEYYGIQYDYGTNLGGWPASVMRTYINDLDAASDEDGIIYNALPEELRKGIIDTYVVSSSGPDKTKGEVENENAGVLASGNYWSNDKLYLLSVQEVYGTSFAGDSDTSNGTSRQLDYYEDYQGYDYTGVSTTNYSGAIKQNTGSNSWWWLRSANSYNVSYFYSIDTGGKRNDSGSIYSSGITPSFRLAD